MITTDLATPTRALAIGAHPDDIEFGCGATLAKWADAGCEIHLLVLTDGSKGSWEPDEDVEALVEVRKREAQAAGGVLGARDVHFLNEIDGELGSGLRPRAGVCRVIRLTQPTVVLGHDPWKHYRLHPDHRHAGLLTVEGVVAARDPHFFPDLDVDPHRPDTILLFEAQEPTHVEAVPDHVGRKVDALLEHRSQWRSTMGIHADPEAERGRFTEEINEEARSAGALVQAGLLGEAFARIDET